jgi:hypothetical protein
MNTARLSHKRSAKRNQSKPLAPSFGLKQWVLPRLTPGLLNKALELEAAAGPADGQVLIHATNDSMYGQYAEQVGRLLREEGEDETEVNLAFFRMGISTCLRAMDLLVVR